MKQKTRTITVSVAVALIFAVMGSTVAYLVTNAGQDNVISIGKGKSTIKEDFGKPPKLNEGNNIYRKVVSVTNTGETPCFVRVFMDFSDSSVKNSTFFYQLAENETIPVTAPNADSSQWESAESWEKTPPSGWNYIPLNDTSGLGGYYYYTQPVAPAEQTTEPLITWVKTRFDSSETITDYDILVYSETVQLWDINGKNYNTDTPEYQSAWKSFLRQPTP